MLTAETAWETDTVSGPLGSSVKRIPKGELAMAAIRMTATSTTRRTPPPTRPTSAPAMDATARTTAAANFLPNSAVRLAACPVRAAACWSVRLCASCLAAGAGGIAIVFTAVPLWSFGPGGALPPGGKAPRFLMPAVPALGRGRVCLPERACLSGLGGISMSKGSSRRTDGPLAARRAACAEDGPPAAEGEIACGGREA